MQTISKEELNQLDMLNERYDAQFISIAKEHLRDYVETVTQPVRGFGHNAYVCPCCKSGTGNNGHYTPAFFLFRSREGDLLYKCHSCHATGNIFTLAGALNNLPNFQAQKQWVANFLGVDLPHHSPLDKIQAHDNATPPAPNTQDVTRLKQEAIDYISACQNNISKTDYFSRRGLSDRTIQSFRLGYDPEKHMAIIPFGQNYYVGRNIGIGADAKGAHKHYKPTGLRQPLFNVQAITTRKPVFITEAPLDALSIIEAGGIALALGGTATTLLESPLRVFRPECCFVLALDNDGPGKRAQAGLARLMDGFGLAYTQVSHPVFAQFKDANAALMADPTAFHEAVVFEGARAQRLLDERSEQREASAQSRKQRREEQCYER